VCLDAVNQASGGDVRLGCLTGEDSRPYGMAETTFSHPDGLRVRGWVRDPDTTGPLTVSLVLDGDTAHATQVVADRFPPATHAGYPLESFSHSFEVFLPIPDTPIRSRELVVTGRNVGRGTDNELLRIYGTRFPGVPFGEVNIWDSTAEPGVLRLYGWAMDPDTTAPATITADGELGEVTTVANLRRTDLPPRFAALGTDHGFDLRVPLRSGLNIVCVGAENAAGEGVGGGTLGCTYVIRP
jgi:hypothetical protein